MLTAHPAPTPEEFQGIQQMRLRGDDVNRLLGLYAADAELKRAGADENIQRRMRLLPNGWRDLRMIQQRLARLTDAIQWTIPQEKRVGFARTASRCRYIVMQGPLASRPKADTEEIVTTDELNTLVGAAWDGKCRMCFDGDCDRCELGKVLDNLISQDRDGRHWGTMEVRR